MKQLLHFKILNRYALFLILYVLTASGIAITVGDKRPFFTGYWFLQVPHTIHDYGIYVLSINEEKRFKPDYLEKSSGVYFHSWSFDSYGIAQNIGKSFDAGDFKKSQEQIEILRTIVFKNAHVRFELHRRTIDPIEFIKYDKVIHVETLKSFEVGPLL